MSLHSEKDEPVVAVVGLGNPGPQYEHTRHNVGFMVVDRLAAGFGIAMQERKFRASWGSGFAAGRKILLAKPSTYMNLSGIAVSEILKYFDFPSERVLVVHDDLDLPCGRIRLVRGGGAGGHKGIASIIAQLNTRDFPRLKLGIGRPLHGEAIESYVLQPPYAEEGPVFAAMVVHGEQAARGVLEHGLSSTMNVYNRKATDE